MYVYVSKHYYVYLPPAFNRLQYEDRRCSSTTPSITQMAHPHTSTHNQRGTCTVHPVPYKQGGGIRTRGQQGSVLPHCPPSLTLHSNHRTTDFTTSLPGSRHHHHHHHHPRGSGGQSSSSSSSKRNKGGLSGGSAGGGVGGRLSLPPIDDEPPHFRPR